MPWKETRVEDQRMKFVVDYQSGEWTMAALCREAGISRKTGYKLIRRYEEEGPEGLRDRSRAPHHQACAVSPAVEAGIVAARAAHPTWGPKKLGPWLRRHQPQVAWPAATSTIGAVLRRRGLTVSRRRVRRTPPYSQPFAACQGANDVWCADFKGWFRTGDGRRCDPFTVTDAHTRFLLRCQMLPQPSYEWVKPVLDAAFREYGLPRAIRTDNGPPFASLTLAGLSRLSIEWIKLGIIPERIAPGKPAQNGRHERMHRTLEEDTARPPKANGRLQQGAFDCFRQEFNYERPHEVLQQQTPGSVYQPSLRPCPLRLPEVEYPDGFHVRRVRHSGEVRWQGTLVYLSQTLAGEPVGFHQLDDRHWQICFGPVPLALWDAHRHQLIKPRKGQNTLNPMNEDEQMNAKVLPM